MRFDVYSLLPLIALIVSVLTGFLHIRSISQQLLAEQSAASALRSQLTRLEVEFFERRRDLMRPSHRLADQLAQDADQDARHAAAAAAAAAAADEDAFARDDADDAQGRPKALDALAAVARAAASGGSGSDYDVEEEPELPENGDEEGGSNPSSPEGVKKRRAAVAHKRALGRIAVESQYSLGTRSIMVLVLGTVSARRQAALLAQLHDEVELRSASVFFAQEHRPQDVITMDRDWDLALLVDGPRFPVRGRPWHAPLDKGLSFLAARLDQDDPVAPLDAVSGVVVGPGRPEKGQDGVSKYGSGTTCHQFVVADDTTRSKRGRASARKHATAADDLVVRAEPAPEYGTRMPGPRCLRCSAVSSPAILVRADALRVALLDWAPAKPNSLTWWRVQLLLLMGGARLGLSPEFLMHQASDSHEYADGGGMDDEGDADAHALEGESDAMRKVAMPSAEVTSEVRTVLDEERRACADHQARIKELCSCAAASRNFDRLRRRRGLGRLGATEENEDDGDDHRMGNDRALVRTQVGLLDPRQPHPLNDFGLTPFVPLNQARVDFAEFGRHFLKPCFETCNFSEDD